MEKRVRQFIRDLKRKQVGGSHQVAEETAALVRICVSCSNGRAKSLMAEVRKLGHRLTRAAPLELAIGNVIRRALAIIREEYAETADAMATGGTGASPLPPAAAVPGGRDNLRTSTVRRADYALAPALEGILTRDEHSQDFNEPFNLKNQVLSSLSLFTDGLAIVSKNISEMALEHIHAQEVILTFGKSRTVEEFLKAAARKRTFAVVVAESAPSYRGIEMGRELAAAGIDTTLISDSAVFAMMARVNKVIVGVHAVLANGGLLAHTGAHMIAQAAKHHSVPFVVLSGLFKLTPLYPSDQDTFNQLGSPGAVLPFDAADSAVGTNTQVVVHNPSYDYVPPELVSVLITNQGAHNPTYIYRLLAEFYSQDDHEL